MTNKNTAKDDAGGRATEASPNTPGDGYADTNNRDVDAKQSTSPRHSEAFEDPDIDASKVEVLPGTGGPDDVGDIEIEPEDYNRTGH
jgi:hypothetical protein